MTTLWRLVNAFETTLQLFCLTNPFVTSLQSPFFDFLPNDDECPRNYILICRSRVRLPPLCSNTGGSSVVEQQSLFLKL